MFRLIRMLILFMSPEPVINHPVTGNLWRREPRKKGEFDQTKYVQYVIGGRNRNTPSNLQQQGQTQGTETEREAQGTFALI